MGAPTQQTVAKRLLRDLGFLSLDPSDALGGLKITANDIDDVAGVMTAAAQEMAKGSPAEVRQQPDGGVLHAPTNVTLTATNGSKNISLLTTFATWMPGCTIRITGDDQDNEVLSASQLARPFMGTTGAGIAAVVYGDCIPLNDDTVAQVLSPMFLPNMKPLHMAQDRAEFLRLGGWPVSSSNSADYPLWSYGRKALASEPETWFVDATYNPGTAYLPRRIRFSPMPSVATLVAWTALLNPIRITAENIRTSASVFTDPGAVLPVANGEVESIFMPIARQILTGLPTFKNEGIKPEIARAFQLAKQELARLRGTSGGKRASYPG